MSSHCLVSGGSGFIGRYLVKSLIDSGNTVMVIDRVKSNQTDTIIADITDDDLKIGNQKFKTVYHLAGLAHMVARTPAEREAFFKVNETGTRNLLHALENVESMPESIVFLSTVAVYGLKQGDSINESTPKKATDPYGASKARAEDIVIEWAARFEVRAAVVRLPLVLGADAPGNFGAMVRGIRRRRYFGIGSGTARRSMILAEDISAALQGAINVGGIFHVTDGYHPSFSELEDAIVHALKIGKPLRLPYPIAWIAAKIGDLGGKILGKNLPFNSNIMLKMTSTLTFDDSRARSAFNWQPKSVLEQVGHLVN